MRQDQFERLQVLGEKLMDSFLDEADPKAWPGAGTPVANLTQQTRGDLYWTKKNAAATAVLYGRVEQMVGQQQGAMNAPDPDADGAAAAESQLDSDIASAEKEAKRLMSDLRKREFDKRVHGGKS